LNFSSDSELIIIEMKRSHVLLSILLVIFTGINLRGQNANPEYSIVNKIPLPGDGGWDYLSVDEAGSRLFVSHSTVVLVVDLKTSKLIGTINDTPGVHGIALAEDQNKAFISVGRNASVKVINFKTLEPLADIKITGQNPDAIMYDPRRKYLFLMEAPQMLPLLMQKQMK
jgi:DNA-binding beta-propeller fold protein YncE